MNIFGWVISIPEIFLHLLNISITASWMILAIILFRVLLKKAPKAILCLLWGLVAFRLVFPISIESTLSLIPSTETVPQEIITNGTFDINTGITPVDTRVNEYLGDHYYEGITVPVNSGYNAVYILSLIWIAGMLCLALYALISYLRLRKQIAPSIKADTGIYICDQIKSPFILGFFKPKIYMPSEIDETTASHVIAHEKAHIARKDHWWKPIGFAILTVYWFNPLIWVAYILLCRDIEMACDEKVVKDMSIDEIKAYSEALLLCSIQKKLVAACPVAFGEVGVKNRIRSILNYKKPAFWIIAVAVVLCIVTAVCFLTDPISSMVVKSEKNPDDSDVIGLSWSIARNGLCYADDIHAVINDSFGIVIYDLQRATIITRLSPVELKELGIHESTYVKVDSRGKFVYLSNHMSNLAEDFQYKININTGTVYTNKDRDTKFAELHTINISAIENYEELFDCGSYNISYDILDLGDSYAYIRNTDYVHDIQIVVQSKTDNHKSIYDVFQKVTVPSTKLQLGQSVILDHNISLNDIPSITIGATLPELIYANNEFVIIQGSFGVIVYDITKQQITTRLTYYDLQKYGSFPSPMMATVSTYGEYIYLGYIENPAMSGKIVYLYVYDVETKNLTRTDYMPTNENVFSNLIYVSPYDEQYEDLTAEHLLCEIAVQQGENLFYARLPNGATTFIDLQLVIKDINTKEESVFNIFS